MIKMKNSYRTLAKTHPAYSKKQVAILPSIFHCKRQLKIVSFHFLSTSQQTKNISVMFSLLQIYFGFVHEVFNGQQLIFYKYTR